MTPGTTRLFGLTLIALLCGLWEVAARTGGAPSALLPPFSAVAANLWELFLTRNLAAHIAVSLARLTAALVLAVPGGMALGALLAANRGRPGVSLAALLSLLSQVNPFLLYHTLLTFLGIGDAVKVAILFWGCLWPVAFNTAAGVEHLDRTLLKAGRAFGGGRGVLFLRIILPAAAPRIWAGVRLAAGSGLFMLSAAEILGARSGLGYLLVVEQAYFRILNLFSIVLVCALLGVAVDGVFALIQRKLIPYEVEGGLNSSEN